MLFILHADHEQNCSTNAVRSVGSSHVDPYSAVAAGVAALYGPLHGGANEAVLKMLRRIESTENVPGFLEGVKNREERLMGFGHRVYKNYDPRARIIKKNVDEVLEATGDNPLLDIAVELEKRALDDEFFTSRKLYPNVDFYSGLIYEALRIPTDMFTVIFAIPRTSGWVAQWMELNEDERPEDRPAAPDLHRRARPRVPADRRALGPGEDHRPAGPAAEAGPPRRLSTLGFRLTIRHGPRVTRERHPDLQAALAALRGPGRADPRRHQSGERQDAARVRALRAGRGPARDLDRVDLPRPQRRDRRDGRRLDRRLRRRRRAAAAGAGSERAPYAAIARELEG